VNNGLAEKLNETEVAVANAARVGNHLQILSSGATTSIEDAIAARGVPVWLQVHMRKWEVTQALIGRAERAGSPVVVVTVDGGAPTMRPFFVCGAPIRGNAMAAMAAVLRTTSREGPTTRGLTSATRPA
jgi:isopentenyl diphosphate isomerase/L-lactate dehydrogenase-like FMN-dependent dehydrogenase